MLSAAGPGPRPADAFLAIHSPCSGRGEQQAPLCSDQQLLQALRHKCGQPAASRPSTGAFRGVVCVCVQLLCCCGAANRVVSQSLVQLSWLSWQVVKQSWWHCHTHASGVLRRSPSSQSSRGGTASPRPTVGCDAPRALPHCVPPLDRSDQHPFLHQQHPPCSCQPVALRCVGALANALHLHVCCRYGSQALPHQERQERVLNQPLSQGEEAVCVLPALPRPACATHRPAHLQCSPCVSGGRPTDPCSAASALL